MHLFNMIFPFLYKLFLFHSNEQGLYDVFKSDKKRVFAALVHKFARKRIFSSYFSHYIKLNILIYIIFLICTENGVSLSYEYT